MRKFKELIGPSCLTKAQDDEPLFVLRANDPIAPAVVKLWAIMAIEYHEPEKIKEAKVLAQEMESWRLAKSKQYAESK